MSNISRWFFGFFLAVLWPGLLPLHAEEPSPAVASSKHIVPSSAEGATPWVDSAVQMAQQEIRDPFARDPETEVPEVAPEAQTPAVMASAAPELKVELQGIGFGSKDAYAVIGGEVFYSGDEKKGIKLVEVRRREVDILVNGGKVTIPLFPDQDLQKAKDRAEKKSVMNASVNQSSEMSSFLSGREQPPL